MRTPAPATTKGAPSEPPPEMANRSRVVTTVLLKVAVTLIALDPVHWSIVPNNNDNNDKNNKNNNNNRENIEQINLLSQRRKHL
jgi:hypothetical protein